MTHVLFLMRHATAEPYAPLSDKYRPLTPAGREEAGRIREKIAGAGISYVLVSAAARTRQTASCLELGVETESLEALYGASPEMILDHVRELDEEVGTALVVGHSPGIPDLVQVLANADSDPEASALVATHFPTATCCRFEFSGPWAELSSARLTEVYRAHLPR